MNTLGQLKVLLELQSLRNFSGQPASSGISAVTSQFAGILEEMMQSQTSDSLRDGTHRQLNTLGEVFQHSQTYFQQPIVQSDSRLTTPEAVAPKHSVHDGSIENIVQRAADTYQLPAKLIKSIIRHESNFNPRAISRAGASGLMQLMPATARGLGVTNIMDPEQNVMAGAKYIRSMLDKYDGNLKLALAAYNAGPGNVDKYGGVPPFKETINYVRKVTNTFFG